MSIEITVSEAMTTRQRFEILLSPLLVLTIGHVSAQVFGQILGAWAWVPLALVFWSTIGLLSYRYEGLKGWRARFNGPSGAWGWALLAVLIGLLPLPLFLQNWKLLLPIQMFLPWLVFGLVNPWFEEGYWRGLLFDACQGWPSALRIAYTTFVFAISHPLMFGVNSIGVRSPEVLISTAIMGSVWALIYLKTRSLRWCVASHVMVDLLSVSVPVFLNEFVPPGAR